MSQVGTSENLFKSTLLITTMAIGITLFILVAAVVLIYILVEFKRMRHKLFAIFLIVFIILSYISILVIFKDQEVDLKSVPGVIAASRLYFSWLGSVFVNVKHITTNAIKMDWGTNKSVEDFDEPIIGAGS